jgi:cytidyltransferase-like protein
MLTSTGLLALDSDLLTIAALAISLAILVPTIILTYRLLHPTIIKYPWPKNEAQNLTIVFAGSFNPPHNGHLSMVKYLADKYKEVILVIGMNPNKKYKVLPSARAEMLERMVASLGLDKSRVRVKGEYTY